MGGDGDGASRRAHLAHNSLRLGCLILSDCAQQTIRYSRVNTTQQQFLQDRYACIQEATQTAAVANQYRAVRREVVSRSAMVSCLAARDI